LRHGLLYNVSTIQKHTCLTLAACQRLYTVQALLATHTLEELAQMSAIHTLESEMPATSM